MNAVPTGRSECRNRNSILLHNSSSFSYLLILVLYDVTVTVVPQSLSPLAAVLASSLRQLYDQSETLVKTPAHVGPALFAVDSRNNRGLPKYLKKWLLTFSGLNK